MISQATIVGTPCFWAASASAVVPILLLRVPSWKTVSAPIRKRSRHRAAPGAVGVVDELDVEALVRSSSAKARPSPTGSGDCADRPFRRRVEQRLVHGGGRGVRHHDLRRPGARCSWIAIETAAHARVPAGSTGPLPRRAAGAGRARGTCGRSRRRGPGPRRLAIAPTPGLLSASSTPRVDRARRRARRRSRTAARLTSSIISTVRRAIQLAPCSRSAVSSSTAAVRPAMTGSLAAEG